MFILGDDDLRDNRPFKMSQQTVLGESIYKFVLESC